MISSKDFHRVDYKEPRFDDDRPKIFNLFGIDSEAYTSGVPFMFCTSDSRVFDPKISPECFFVYDNYPVNFLVWNLKYDSGAFLYHISPFTLKQLWETGEAYFTFNDIHYKFKYVPHKLLRITSNKRLINFWEISQFYRSTLDIAAQTYLDESKLSLQTKSFSPRYVEIHRKLLVRYCIRDAQLTARLGVYLIDKLEQFGITASPGLTVHGVIAKPPDEIGQLRGDQLKPAVGFRGGIP